MKQPPRRVGSVTRPARSLVPVTTRDQGPDHSSAHDLSDGTPPPLAVAASLAVVQGLMFVLYGVLELVNLSGDRVTMGITTSVFFVGWGVALALAARQLLRRESWVRAPVVMMQLVLLGVATGFWGGGTTWVAVLMGTVALVTVAGVLHPRSIAAFADAG